MATSLFSRKPYDQVSAKFVSMPTLSLSWPKFADGDFEDGAGMTLWICPPGERYRLHYFSVQFDVPSDTASANTVMPERLQAVEAAGAGDDLLTTALSLLGADDTVDAGVLAASTADGTFDFRGGDRLGYVGAATGDPANLAGCCLKAVLIPIYQTRHVYAL